MHDKQQAQKPHNQVRSSHPGGAGGSRAIATILNHKAMPALPVMPPERIDRIAELTVKGMPDGLQGFARSWGWQQFARSLMNTFDSTVLTYGQDVLMATRDRLAKRTAFETWIQRESPAGCVSDMLRGWKACADALLIQCQDADHRSEGHVECLSCDWTGPKVDACPSCGGETCVSLQALKGIQSQVQSHERMANLLREIVAYCRESGHTWLSLDEADALLAAPNRRAILAGWHIRQCDDGSIVVDGPTGGAVCNQITKVDRKAPEEVLWALAHALLAEDALGTVNVLPPVQPDPMPSGMATSRTDTDWCVTLAFSSQAEAEAWRSHFAQRGVQAKSMNTMEGAAA